MLKSSQGLTTVMQMPSHTSHSSGLKDENSDRGRVPPQIKHKCRARQGYGVDLGPSWMDLIIAYLK